MNDKINCTKNVKEMDTKQQFVSLTYLDCERLHVQILREERKEPTVCEESAKILRVNLVTITDH